MKTTLRFTVMLCAILTCTQTFAEARAPQLVISTFIEALQKDDMEYLMKYVDLQKIESQPRHGYTVEALKKVFAEVQLNEVDLAGPLYEKETKVITVRMNKPLSFDFELQHQNAFKVKGDFYRIIGLYP